MRVTGRKVMPVFHTAKIAEGYHVLGSKPLAAPQLSSTSTLIKEQLQR